MPSVVQNDAGVVVLPVEPHHRILGIVMVSEQAAGQIACNGIPLALGMHALRHADRFEIRLETYWISVEYSVEETEYDPSRYPPNSFCFLTKARLVAGDPIAICPGTPDIPCGMIYKLSVWKMTQQSGTTFRCPNCGHSPARAGWAPPEPRRWESLKSLMDLAGWRRQERP